MNLEELFFSLHEGLPRQGPGSTESTYKALSSVSLSDDSLNILDIGCGPGMQTRLLAKTFPNSSITALDNYRPFLDQLESASLQEGITNITCIEASMFDLPFDTGSFDLIWSEGAIYIMGFSEGLVQWKPLLKPGGYLAVSELVWIKDHPPEIINEYWKLNYPGITTIEENKHIIHQAGYELCSHFTLPSKDWFTHYYTPLEENISHWDMSIPGSSELISMEQEEIRMMREYSDWYSYEFFIMKAP